MCSTVFDNDNEAEEEEKGGGVWTLLLSDWTDRCVCMCVLMCVCVLFLVRSLVSMEAAGQTW